MDYGRIYAAFIADRQQKQPNKPAYFERHHVVPRRLGGSNSPGNLIRLTPEDHFFAHLLLAKIHGGQMWSPVAFMVGGDRKNYRPTVSRKKYGWVVRALSRSKRGTGAYQFDYAVRTFVHKDGRVWSGTQSEMHSVLGIGKPSANNLIKRKVKSAKGWAFEGVEGGKVGGEKHGMYRREVHHFVHVDGREFIGTQFEFHKACGMHKPAACKLARGEAKVWNGWHLKGVQLPTQGRGKRWASARPEPSAT